MSNNYFVDVRTGQPILLGCLKTLSVGLAGVSMMLYSIKPPLQH